MRFVVKKTISPTRLSGTVPVPGSKSHTIRALLIASRADGVSVIKNPLFSSDTEACIEACRAFGASVKRTGNDLEVEGAGSTFAGEDRTIDVGNSGTTLYLAAGLAATGQGRFTFTGDDQIRRRPIGPLLNSLRDLGAEAVSIKNNDCAPIVITGPLHDGATIIECPTSQFLSSLLLAAPLADPFAAPLAKRDSVSDGAEGVHTPADREAGTNITVPLLNEAPYIRMTLSWLDALNIQYRAADDLSRFFVPAGQQYTSFNRTVPGDFSSATFFLCAAAVTGSTITLENVDMNDTQGDKEVIDILQSMGCRIHADKKNMTVTIVGAPLTGREIDLNAIPDALPALAVVGCFAEGTTRLVNVPQARLKETDRISVMKQELSKMGAKVEEMDDGLIIQKSRLRGASVFGHHDHRVVMALSVAGLAAEGKTVVDTAEAVSVTFPEFFSLIEQLRKG